MALNYISKGGRISLYMRKQGTASLSHPFVYLYYSTYVVRYKRPEYSRVLHHLETEEDEVSVLTWHYLAFVALHQTFIISPRAAQSLNHLQSLLIVCVKWPTGNQT